MGVVLVTGGAGFIGSHLVEQLVRQNERVRVLERRGASVDHLPLNKIDLVFGDIRDRQNVDQAMVGVNSVYHLAANPNLWVKPRGLFYQVNYLGAKNVLDSALAAGVLRILHTSTESILTRSCQKEPIREDQIVPPADVIGPYCRSKYLAEKYAFHLARKGHPILIVNPTLPVGPGDRGQSPPTKMILDFCKGKRREYVDAELNLIDVRDVAAGMRRVMQIGQPGRRYLLGNENVSIKKVFGILAKITGLPEPHRRVPFSLALIAACLSEIIADTWTHKAPAATLTGVLLTQRRMHFDSTRSLQELSLMPRPAESSLQDAVDWYRTMGWM